MARVLLLAAQVFYAIVRAYQAWRQKERAVVVRADPGTAWLRKFGGVDGRAKQSSSGSRDARGPDHG